MQKLNIFVFIIILALSCPSDLFGQKLDHVLGEVIVEVRNDRGVTSLMKDLSTTSNMRSSLNARQITSEPMNLWVIKTNPNVVNEIHLLNEITMHNEVLLAQKNHIAQLRAIPNDPLFNNQWQYLNTGQNGGVVGADIDMDLAWDVATGGLTTEGDTIVICVIDDGINNNHPDLGDNLWINHQEIPDNDIDDDGNGYTDDYFGWSAFTDNGIVYTGGGHGTPVAGIIGAKGNNGIGVSGVLWDVKLMIVNGEGPEARALASYAYPYTMRKLYNETNGEKGAFVVCTNSSWGVDLAFPEEAPIWCDFYNLLGEVGILNFGATANSNYNVDEVGDLPTSCQSDYLVTVTNMNREDEKEIGAGYGIRSIDLGAYGKQIYTINSSGYGEFGGTSAATPHVAGTAALLYSADCPDFISLSKSDPSLAALVVKDCILFGVKPNQSLDARTTTGGTLNAFNAINNLMSTCGDCTTAFGGRMGELTHQFGSLTWFDNGSIGNTSIRYRILEDPDWIEIENVESGIAFDDLVTCSVYEFQTKTICTNNPNAKYSYSKIFETDGCCEAPTGIDIQVSEGMATIEWDEVFSASNYIVEWRNAADSIWNIANLGVDNLYLIDDILECEFYMVRIRTQCADLNNESEYSEIFDIKSECDGCTQEFCTLTNKDTSDEWIESVEITDVFTNVSGVSENGYQSFFGQFDIVLNANNEYSITLTPGYTSIEFAEYFSAYIDYNFDGEFGDNEAIFTSDFATMQAITGTFTVPFNATEGITRMRVIMRFGEFNGPCDNFGFEFGEIEEYCVEIIGFQDCPTQFFTTVPDTTLTSITFEHLQSDLVDSYLTLIRIKGSTDFDTISSSSNQILISDLIKCTEYEYKSGYVCQGETFIDSEVFTIFTLCDVGTPELDIISLNMYPNPSFGNIIIEFINPAKSDATIDLISVDGKSYRLKNKIKKADTSIFVETQEVPPGVYILKINFENSSVSKKWVKY